MSCKLQVVNCVELADGVTSKTLLKITSVNVGFCERLQLSTIHRWHPSFGWLLNIHTKMQLTVTADNVEYRAA